MRDLLRRLDGSRHTVDVGGLQARIFHCVQRGVGMKLELRHIGDDAKAGGLGRADNGDLIAAHRISLSPDGIREA